MVRKIQDVHGVGLSPLLVTVFVATSDIARKDIPANITELFKKYTEMMLGRWDLSKGLSQQYIFPLKDFLLKKIAYEMHAQKTTYITRKECERFFETELEKLGKKSVEIDLLINEIINRSGLFRCYEDKIEFRHLLLQEFFAGRGIPSPDLIPSLVTDYWWQKVIIFYFGEHPSASQDLIMVVNKLTALPPKERFQSSVTIGLSLQACYLIQVTTKLDIFKWVIGGLASVKGEVDREAKKYPLREFLIYYLFGRDAVACEILETNIKKIIEEVVNKESNLDQKELLIFWLIVGLIEGGFITHAEQMLHDFHPKDDRLLLALHLGCILIEHLKVTTTEQKDIAKRICKHIAPKIEVLRKELLGELSSELLEIQQGKLKALEAPK